MGLLSEAIATLIPERKSAIGASIPTWEDKMPQTASYTQSYARLAGQGYIASEVVYECVEARATSAAEPKIVCYKGDEKIDDHESLDLLNHPNPFMDGFGLMEATMMYHDIGGNAYWEKVRAGSGKLVQIWTLRPDRTRVIPSAKTFIGGYQYRIGDQTFTLAPEDVVHFKTRHPMDDFHGLPPLAVLSGRIDIEVWCRQFVEAWFRNAGVPAGLLNIMRSVTDQERELIRQRFRQQYGGPHGWASLMVLDGGQATYTQMGSNVGQGLPLQELEQVNEVRTCGVYGVPLSLVPTMAGMQGNRGATAATSDRELFWQGTLAPIYRKFGATITRGLKDEYPEIDRWEFDLSTVQALQEDQDKLFTRWRALVTDGVVTREEARLKLGLPEKPEETGIYLISSRVVPTPSDWDPNTPEQAPRLPTAPADTEQVNADGQLSAAQVAELLPGEGKVALPAGRSA